MDPLDAFLVLLGGDFLVDLVDEIGFFFLEEEEREDGRDEVFLDDLAFLEGDTDFFGLLMSIP